MEAVYNKWQNQFFFINNENCVIKIVKNPNIKDDYILGVFYVCFDMGFDKMARYITKKRPSIIPFLKLDALADYYCNYEGICMYDCIKQAKWFVKIKPTIAIGIFKFFISENLIPTNIIATIKIAKYILQLNTHKYSFFIRENKIENQKKYNKKWQIAKLL